MEQQKGFHEAYHLQAQQIPYFWINLGPFRFEQFWLNHPNFRNKVHQWWEGVGEEEGNYMFKFMKNLKILKGKIKKLNKEVFDNIFEDKAILEERMEML